ncbi:BirA family transcriptional regulator, biotin operon repressor / biotin-[acetyl-CoA-carboxylase] ligase [Gemmobacter megaterium]|uniref:biotin--[biotin carboxyl-carrier protein] ligase n=1 Tax=Gemmobacter megaterium TaxID=1086013 RepID=A0A1N7KV06_9RHOB|nr:biotin--[acetyl-CoA-carboxylase] ligase [Gemmobacter megaterium]GGE03975.1 biotin--[acetyl-CoA-carboxylase] ligase [Gemmobacter megaterium]SIS65428.1 BirA family transcriptional regulator, biotin operon repressor / biotin-[acetyl-CoA-carboxylase] ligase [Gemmobacter megaterium]
MSAEVWPEGVGRVILETVESTNAEAARRAASCIAPTWILAGFQTGGRGRRARPWVSPRGNFHATLLMRPAGGAGQAALRSFMAALALHEALAGLTGTPQAFRLKWPNDVLLNGGKVSGILLESLGAQGGVDHLAIGIGVNLIAAPAPTEVEAGAVLPVSVLAETGMRIAPETLLTSIAASFARLESVLEAEGFAPIRALWLDHAARLGERIVARIGAHTHEGIFEGIDSTGALVLRTQAGTLNLPAADIYF